MSKLCVDYGHYGQDSGATYKGRKEVELVTLIGDELQNILRANGNEVWSSYGTFENRKLLSANADYLISIHTNATLGATGNEVLISRNASTKSRAIANSVLEEVTKETGLRNRGVKIDFDYLGYDLYVLKKITCPSILVECGFIEKDWENVDIKGFASEYARSIAKGIFNHLGQVSKCSLCGK